MICGACGRKLKDPESILRGYGPVCYRRLFGSPPKRNKSQSSTEDGGELENYEVPGQISMEEYLDSLGDQA